MRTSPERNVLGCQHVKKESPLDLRGQGVLEKTFGEAQIFLMKLYWRKERGTGHHQLTCNAMMYGPLNQHQIRTEIHKVLGQDVSS